MQSVVEFNQTAGNLRRTVQCFILFAEALLKKNIVL
jgi:hypothetical protein